jgi:hypothetical protein
VQLCKGKKGRDENDHDENEKRKIVGEGTQKGRGAEGQRDRGTAGQRGREPIV